MTILKALKNLIAKSGGTTKAGTIAEAINDMPVGGGGPLVVTVTGNDDIGYVADKTYNEIAEAFPNVTVLFSSAEGTWPLVFSPSFFSLDGPYGFSNTDVASNKVTQQTFTIDTDDSISYFKNEYPSGK